MTAYDRRRGNPFKAWRIEDFDLESGDFDIQVTGGSIDERTGNSIGVSVTDPADFSLRVHGYDMNRDLKVTTHVTEISE